MEQLEDVDGGMRTGEEEMTQVACKYFTYLFTSRGIGDSTRLLTRN